MDHASVSAEKRSRGLASRSTAVAMSIACGLLLALMVLRGHAIGGEIWGPIAGVMALAASIFTFAVHRSSGRVGRTAIVLLWIVVIVLGVAGTIEHADPVLPGSLDPRSRPPLVPLVYSMLGVVGIMMVFARSRGGEDPDATASF